MIDINDLALLLSHFGLGCTSGLTGGGGEPGGESMMSGGESDPLTEWLKSATPEEVLDGGSAASRRWEEEAASSSEVPAWISRPRAGRDSRERDGRRDSRASDV